MTRYFFILIFLMFQAYLFAQQDFKPGYIIRNNGDTIYGQINYQGDNYNALNCLFRQDSSKEAIHYNPRDIMAYRFIDSKFYVSKQVTLDGSQRMVFLEFLVNGIARLYYLPPDIYFIEKDSSKLQILENKEHSVYNTQDDYKEYVASSNQYIGMLKIYFHDCPQIQNEINNAKLRQASLIKITTDYHKYMCPGKECTVYVKKSPKTIVNFGISLGTNDNMVDLNDLYLSAHNREWSFGPSIGLHLDLFNTRSFERFFLSAGVNYSEIHHDIYFRGPLNSYVKEVKFLSRNLYFHLTLNYMYPRFKIKPFIGLGIAEFWSMKSSENKSPSIIYYPVTKNFGPECKVGILTSVSKRISFKFYGSYQYGVLNSNRDIYYLAAINNLNLAAAVQFSLGH